MTNLERNIKFDTAVEIINKVYSDYCNDNTKTREQAGKFLDFMHEMNNMREILKTEAQKEENNE